MAEPMSMPNFSKTVGAAHKRLNEIGAPEDERGTAYRLYPVLDRLYLRAEGEPDCADLVGKINEVCDYEGIGEGSPVERVEALAGRCREAASELKRQADRCGHYIDRVHMLEADRAQLAEKEKPVRDMTPREIAEAFALLCLTDREKAGRLLPKFSGLYSMVEDL